MSNSYGADLISAVTSAYLSRSENEFIIGDRGDLSACRICEAMVPLGENFCPDGPDKGENSAITIPTTYDTSHFWTLVPGSS